MTISELYNKIVEAFDNDNHIDDRFFKFFKCVSEYDNRLFVDIELNEYDDDFEIIMNFRGVK